MASKKPVICLYCGEQINRDTDDWVRPNGGVRYAHAKCAELQEKDEEYKAKILAKLDVVFSGKVSYQKVSMQLKSYKKDGMTYENIYHAIQYFYDVKHSDPALAHGAIGIVPHIYDESVRYWEEQERIRQRRAANAFVDDTDFVREKIKLKRTPIQRPVNVNFFKLD